jgi:ATP-dependent Clp protease ATP-binding subunit ClpA
VCKFVKLDSLAIKKVVIKFLDELQTSLLDREIRLTLSESVIDMLADKGYDAKMGARPLGRKIDELIRVPLSKKILFDRLSNCAIYADMKDDQVNFKIDAANPVLIVDDEGYVVVDPKS